MTFDLADVVDLDRYPIDAVTSESYFAVVDIAQAGLAATGCAVIKDFIRPQALSRLAKEIRERKGATHFSTEPINPYFHVNENPNFPKRHPVNTFIERSSGFIPGDAWGMDTETRFVFEHPAVCRFFADCLALPELHPYADPLAGLTSNILDPNQQFTWHFDTNEFAITLLVEEADEGGFFEYVPDIRSADDEGFERIQAVLEGGRDGVHTLDLRPGDLQIFRGRYSLHRVSRIEADSCPRHAAIFAYTEKAGVIGRVERTMQLFGRVLPEHIAAEEERIRTDALID